MTYNPLIQTNEVSAKWITAEYHPQELPDYQGNVLIEALPPILSQDEAYDKLMFMPLYDEKERFLSPELRFNALYRLQQFFQPISQHLDLERRFSRLLRSGYLSRNPIDPTHVMQLTNMPIAKVRSTASSFTLMGFSGMGKTTAIERILDLYPQCIIHKAPINKLQIVWLKLNCPHDGSLKSLCMDFFAKVDDLAGTNYYDKFGGSRNSISSMVTQMGRVARLHCIGSLIIDEIQHLLTAKDKGSEKMMNFFVTLINEIGIPIMLIGTMRAKTVLQQDFRQARRGSGQGDMVWEQMPPDDNWDMIIEEMWRYQWTRNKVLLTDDIRECLYDESQGIVDVAVKLYSLAQGRAIETGKETITAQLIKKVAKEDLKIIQPMIQALRSGIASEIEKYADIMPMDLAGFLDKRKSNIDLRAVIQKKKEQQEENRKQFQVSVVEKAILALVSLEFDPSEAEKQVLQLIKAEPTLTHLELVQRIIATPPEKKLSRVSKTSDTSKNVLLQVVQTGKEKHKDAYDSLHEAGWIKSPFDEFAI
jgi:hypothetical protein